MLNVSNKHAEISVQTCRTISTSKMPKKSDSIYTFWTFPFVLLSSLSARITSRIKARVFPSRALPWPRISAPQHSSLYDRVCCLRADRHAVQFVIRTRMTRVGSGKACARMAAVSAGRKRAVGCSCATAHPPAGRKRSHAGGVVRGGTLLPRHVTEQARAYFGTKYNMLHFEESKQSEWLSTRTVTTFASIGNWVPSSALVKGTPLKPRRRAVSDFESREYNGSATDRRSQPAASQHVYDLLKRQPCGHQCESSTRETARSNNLDR